MGTNCAPLVADLFLYCYERDFMTFLFDDNQADTIEAFTSTSRYLDDLLNIDNHYTLSGFKSLYLSNCFVSSKIYDKRDDFDFDIVNFPFLDDDVPRRPSYGVYISQLIRFARVCSHVEGFNARNKCLTAKLLKQSYRYHKLKKAFSKFYRRQYELVSNSMSDKNLFYIKAYRNQNFYGDLAYKFNTIMGRTDFSDQFRKIIIRHKRIGCNLNVMRQSACLVINQITVDNFAALFNCTPVDRASDSMMAPT